MSKFFLLIQTNLKVFLGAMKKKKAGRYVASSVLIAVAVIFVALSFGGQSFLQASMLREAGIPELGIFISLVTAMSLAILIGLMRAATGAKTNDSDLLLSLPVPRFTVIASKIVTQYVFDAPFILLIFGSSVIAYTAFGGGIAAFLRGILLTFLLPLLPITLSYFLGSAIAALSERFRFAKLIATGLLMVLLVGYMIMNFASSGVYAAIENMTKADAAAIINAVVPLMWLTNFVVNGDILSVLLSLLILIVPFYLAIQVFSLVFGRNSGGFRSKNKVIGYRVRSPRMSLYDKEVKRYLNMPLYMFNTAFGPVLMVIFAGTVSFLGLDKVLSIMGYGERLPADIPLWVPPIIISAIFCFMISMTSTTSASLSLEGKSLWILKVNPVSTGDIFFSKWLLNFILVVPISVICVLAVGLRIGQSLPEILLHILVIVILGALVSCVGLIANLLFPRFDWENEAQIVKQSMSVMINLLFCMVVTGLPFPLLIILQPTNGLVFFYAAQFVIYGAFLALSVLFLKTAGKKMFEDFNG